MSKQFTPEMRQRAQALARYMRALETGDLETVAAVLHIAGQDEVLERMILETNDMYQEIDNTVVLPDEIVFAQQRLAILPSLSHDTIQAQQEQQHTDDAVPVALVASKQESRYQTVSIQTHIPDNDEHEVHERIQFPRRLQRRGRRIGAFVQTLAAVLVVGILLGSFVFLFATHHATTGSEGGAGSSQTIVAMSTSDGSVYTLNPTNGQDIWSYETGLGNTSPAYSTIAIQGNVLYFEVMGQVYALQESTGTLLWHTSLHIAHPDSYNGSAGSIVFDGGRMFVIGYDNLAGGMLYALQAEDGKLLWQKPIGYNFTTLVASNGTVYTEVGQSNSPNGFLEALRGGDGHLLWRDNINAFSLLVHSGTLYTYAGYYYTSSSDPGDKASKKLMALNLTNGHTLWSRPFTDFNFGPLLVDGGEILLNQRNTPTTYHFCAYRTHDGSTLWCARNDPPASVGNVTAYAVMNGVLYASYPSGNNNAFYILVEAINASNGAHLWSKRMSGFLPGLLVALGGNVYVVSDNRLYALAASDGHVLWYAQHSADPPMAIAVG